jgi:nitroreductase
MSQIDPQSIDALIRSRRSVFPKQYDGREVPRELIERLLENANWAPTHGLTEPWRFVVFAGEGRKALSEMQSALYRQVSGEAFDEAKYQKLRQNPLQASHVIAICMKRHARIPEVEEIEAVACAVQNMYLTATAYGLGAYWASGGVTYREELKEHFGLGPEDRVLGFFYVGYPAGEVPDSRRGPISEKVSWVTEA